MELLVSKILTAIVLFVLTIFFSFLPYLILKYRSSTNPTSNRRREKAIAYLNCFGGGVFLSTLLIHVLPEGSEEFEAYKSKIKLDTEFPIFNLLVAAGFFIVAFIEHIAHARLAHHNHEVENRQSNELPFDAILGNSGASSYYGAFASSDGESSAAENTHHKTTSQARQEDFEPNPQTKSPNKSKNPTSNAVFPADGNSSHQSDVQNTSHNESSDLRAFLLLIALSFHTIFDGLAVGLQESSAEVWSVFAAVTIHKSIISFCLGLELFQSNTQRLLSAFLWLGVFSIMSPLGICVGVGLTAGAVNETAKLLVSSILQGLAGGTFMYVTFLEILSTYIGHHGKAEISHLLFVIVGFVPMAAGKLLDND